MKTSRILPSSTTNRAGALRGSGLYNACIVGRVVLGHHPPTRPSPCAPSALRGTSGDTMTIPGGASTLYVTYCHMPRARLTGFYHGVGAPTGPLWGSDSSLCPCFLPHF